MVLTLCVNNHAEEPIVDEDFSKCRRCGGEIKKTYNNLDPMDIADIKQEMMIND